jgi:hypothetical protein
MCNYLNVQFQSQSVNNDVKITQIIVIRIIGATNREIQVYTKITNFTLPPVQPYDKRDKTIYLLRVIFKINLGTLSPSFILNSEKKITAV